MAESLVDRMVAILRANEWLVEEDESPGALHLSPSDGEAPWPVVVRVGPDDERVALYSLWPDDIPADRRDAVARLIGDVNVGRDIGSFELDRSDGDLRFRTSVDLGRADVDDDCLAALVGNLIHHNLTAMDECWDAIEAVIGGADPAGIGG